MYFVPRAILDSLWRVLRLDVASASVFDRFWKFGAFLFAASFVSGSVGYALLKPFMRHRFVFPTPRVVWNHPVYAYEHIALMAVVFATLATLCVLSAPRLVGWKRHTATVLVIATTVAIGSPLCGLLWKFQNLRAGYTEWNLHFLMELRSGASQAFDLCWLVVLASIPYNMLAFAAAFGLMEFAFGSTRTAAGEDR
ncbi:MAG: hypothetical protein K1X53_12260 [Candidatus Sumerlaeaceae bacterium]|nr:hypothetical protein [Candidatus Sumerlaeaceae bacterium]